MIVLGFERYGVRMSHHEGNVGVRMALKDQRQ